MNDKINSQSCESQYRNFGNWYKCQLPKGHSGSHKMIKSWRDNE